MSRQALSRSAILWIIAVIGVTIVIIFGINLLPQRLTALRSDRRQVRIYYADNISPAHQEIIDRFNRDYAGRIEVVPIDLPFTRFTTNERKELLARSLRSGNSQIDVFAVDQIWVSRFARWGERLEPYFPPDTLRNVVGYGLETCYYEGDLVALPLYLDIGVLFYRKDLISALPDGAEWERKIQRSLTWQELLDFQRKYYPGQPVLSLQAAGYEGLICNYLEVMGAAGGDLITSRAFRLTDPRAEAACQLLVDLVHRYHAVPEEVTHFNENESYLYGLQHDLPLIRGWPSMTQDTSYLGSAARKVNRLGLAPLPHFAGEAPASVFGGWNLMVSRFSEHKEEAITFIRYLLSLNSQQILYEAGHYLPVRTELYEPEAGLSHPDRIAFLKQLLRQGIHRPAHVNYTRISDVLSEALNETIRRNADVDSTLSAMEQEIRRLLGERQP
ncbi:MAG: extracellular solute-binding protein [Candidatus Neomarinimicrobiota bacterium]|nr:MAG: extracellular solute-binding protein [Candidatus Neomarinimicrobiota bacterium]